MEPGEIKALKQCLPRLIDDLSIDDVALYLKASGVIGVNDYERIMVQKSTTEKRLFFFEQVIKSKTNGWPELIKVLRSSNINQGYLADELEEALKQQRTLSNEESIVIIII